jgi:hypothetical protein
MKTERLTAKILPSSWEKCRHVRLSNGFKAHISYSQHYGDFISRIESPDGKIWQACDGYLSDDNGNWDKFPAELEFARAWVKPTSPGHWQTLMRPEFDIKWD